LTAVTGHVFLLCILLLSLAGPTLAVPVPVGAALDAASSGYPHLLARKDRDKDKVEKAGEKDSEKSFLDKDYGGVTGKEIIIVVAIGSAVITLIVAVVWMRRRSNKAKAAKSREEDQKYYTQEQGYQGQ